MPVTAGTTDSYLPDGRILRLPAAPRTWADDEPGSASQLTRDVSGGVAWHRQRPLFIGLSTSAAAIPNNAYTLVPMNAELVDNYYGHTDASNSSRWWAPASGNTTDYYLVSGYVPMSYSAGTAPTFGAGLRVNGAGSVFEGNRIGATSGHVVNAQVIDLLPLTGSSDYVQLMGFQNTGSSVNTVVSSKCPSLHVRWICSSPGTTVDKPGTLHTWADTDRATADDTGTVGGHDLVPWNREIRDPLRYMNRPPTLRVTTAGTAQTIPASTWTAITLTSQSIDTHGMWDASPNPSRVVCTQAGLYLIAGLFAVDSDATPSGYVQARLRHTIAAGGTADYMGQSAMRATGASSPGDAVYATATIRMAQNDYVELLGWQNDGTKAVKSGTGDSARMIAIQLAA